MLQHLLQDLFAITLVIGFLFATMLVIKFLFATTLVIGFLFPTTLVTGFLPNADIHNKKPVLHCIS